MQNVVGARYPEWKALLPELLAAIAKRLTCIVDYTSFRGVCTCWRSAATFDNFDREFPRPPHLLYFLKETEDEEEAPVPVLDDDSETEETPTPVLDEEKVTKFLDLESNTSKTANFPPPSRYKYLSCSGWILDSNGMGGSSLKHFMLGINIKLPKLFDASIYKIVLSGSPMESNLVVMVIWGYDDQLAFCRPGDERWTLIECWGDNNYVISFSDIIYHNNKLYALESRLNIVECNIHGSNPTKTVEVFANPPDKEIKFGIQKFLVESFGKFLLAVQYMSWNDGSYYFRIFEIELKDGSYKEIDNMGDRCLFLGLNSSICVAASSVQLKPNCIYLAQNKPCGREPHAGVYTFSGDAGYFKVFEDFSGVFNFCFPPPIWLVPSI